MSNLNGYDQNLNNGYTGGGNDIQRPMEGYDTLIRFIDRFPLRLIIVFVGISLLLQLAGAREEMEGDAMMNATLGYIVGFFLVLAEAATGTVTRIIKDLLIRLVMIAERNSAEL